MSVGSIELAFVFGNNAGLFPCLNYRNPLASTCLCWTRLAPSPPWQAPVLSASLPPSGRSSAAAWTPRRPEVMTGGCWPISWTWTGGCGQASGLVSVRHRALWLVTVRLRAALVVVVGLVWFFSAIHLLFILQSCVLSFFFVSCTMVLQTHRQKSFRAYQTRSVWSFVIHFAKLMG